MNFISNLSSEFKLLSVLLYALLRTLSSFSLPKKGVSWVISTSFLDKIVNTEIGITSKDLSEVILSDVKIKDTRLGFAVFQKKEEYGGGKVKITGLEMKNVDLNHLVEPNSSLTINGKDVISKRSKVVDLLYGVNFGKSSE